MKEVVEEVNGVVETLRINLEEPVKSRTPVIRNCGRRSEERRDSRSRGSSRSSRSSWSSRSSRRRNGVLE